MKYKIIAGILFLLLTGSVITSTVDFNFSLGFMSSNPCESPLSYRIGEIDDRYDITEEEIIEIMKQVETVWFSALEKDLLTYSKKGRVAINLVYGEEQERSDDEKDFAERIDVKKQHHKSLEIEYNRLARTYKTRQEGFTNALSEYDRLVKRNNEVIAQWNAKGGVPESEEATINEMKRNLEREKNNLERKQREIESLRKRTNTKAKQLNSVIREEKELIAAYNNRFAKAHKFNQGQFVQKGSEENVFIFQFSNKHDLKTVLAHEFGHAMGLEHVNNPKSIMYEMMDKQNIFDLALTEEDINAIKTRCEE